MMATKFDMYGIVSYRKVQLLVDIVRKEKLKKGNDAKTCLTCFFNNLSKLCFKEEEKTFFFY